MSWEDPRCRRDGPQTTALTDPEGWREEAPAARAQRTLQAAGGPRRRRQEALVLEGTCVPEDARPWLLSPIMISMDTIILRERAVRKEAMSPRSPTACLLGGGKLI